MAVPSQSSPARFMGGGMTVVMCFISLCSPPLLNQRVEVNGGVLGCSQDGLCVLLRNGI